jgi:hypothetical protein
MIRIILLATTLAFSGFAFATSVDVKDVDTSQDDTTIEIHKGKRKAEPLPSDSEAPTPEPSHGGKKEAAVETADVDGESGPLKSDAMKNWSRECSAQEKKIGTEVRQNGDKMYGWNCGKPTCSGDAGDKTCTSKATYKVREQQ